MRFTTLQSTDSTNNYAREQIHAGLAQHGDVFFSRIQLAGKGQRNKTWQAEQDSSILMSIIIHPVSISIMNQFILSAFISNCLVDFFNKITNGDFSVKWPNDLYWQDRKAGGVLIENIISGNGDEANWKWAIVGIGININQGQFPEELPNAVSLKQITGKSFDCNVLANELSNYILTAYDKQIMINFKETLFTYNLHLYKKDKSVRFLQTNRAFTGVVKKVLSDGTLIVDTGREEKFQFGDLQWQI